MDKSEFKSSKILANKSQINPYDSMRRSQDNQVSRYNFRDSVNPIIADTSSTNLNTSLKYDSGFIGKFTFEIEQQVKQGSEYKVLELAFKRAASRFAKDAEGNLLKDLKPSQIESVYRDISRIFDKEEEGEDLKSKIRQIMNMRMEDIRRQIINPLLQYNSFQKKDNKWNVIMSLLQNLMVRNRGNRDCFDLLAFRVIPNDLRQVVWKFCLENPIEADEYSEKLKANRFITISKFDVSIIKDTQDFVDQMCKGEEFDGGMIFCMKTILSYYEVKRDRILSDYLFLICIPLMDTLTLLESNIQTAFGEAKHMHKIPSDLVGYYFSLQGIVNFFDPLVDLLVKHDEKYDAEMTDQVMNTLAIVDEDLANKLNSVLNLELPQARTLLVLVVKRFIHSLGFAFLPMSITLYVWDQFIMKIQRNRIEIFIVMAIMLKCLKDFIYQQETWDQIVDVIYVEAKNIQFELFYSYQVQIMRNSRFYQSPYNVDPAIVNRGAEIFDNPLQQLIDEQQKRDRIAYKKKWLDEQEKKELKSKPRKALDSDSEDEEPDENDMEGRRVQLQKMKTEDIMKNMKTKEQAPEAMGIVPMINQNDSDEIDIQHNPTKYAGNQKNKNLQDSEDDEDEEEEFDVLGGMS